MFKSNKISQISKGGEMMKTLVLVLALMMVVAGASVAATATIDLYSFAGGANLVACPLVPFNPDPAVAFGSLGDLSGMLARFDATTGSDMVYDAQWGPDTTFGNLLLGDGFWLTAGDTTVTYTGVANGVPDATGAKTDMWISLPGNQYDGLDAGGVHLIGNPYASYVDKSLISFTDGTTLKSWNDAAYPSEGDAWVTDSIGGFDGATGNSVTISLGFGDREDMEPARGYFVTTLKDNLAMIITAPAL
jgi:hypothetical protein